jgi:ABC-2 type transport system ATP-binding protein
MNSIKNETKNEASQYSIEIMNLKKIYNGDVKALDGISFSVKKGECFGFIGPNGAGKTTTISILCGLIKPTEGTGRIEGLDIDKDAKKVKELIGVCPQDPAVFKFLNAKENIQLFGNLHLLEKKTLKKRTRELLDKFDLLDVSKRKVKGYSGGMIRRLNLIMALINDPEIIFLDEPTVGMDALARRATWNFIADLKNQAKTIFLTTHYLEELEKLSDRVGIIDYGKLIELGSPQDLMRKYSVENLEDVFIKLTGRRIKEEA